MNRIYCMYNTCTICVFSEIEQLYKVVGSDYYIYIYIYIYIYAYMHLKVLITLFQKMIRFIGV